jgi:hypothetical protein
MKSHSMNSPSFRHPVLAAAAFALAMSAQAAPFLYTPGDLILTFRQSGNAADLVVNIGTAASLSTLAPGARVELTRLDATLLSATFPSFNGLSWSVAGANRPPLVDAYPIQTLWVTSPRTDPDATATPWLRKGSFVQGNAGSQVDAVGKTAASFSSLTPAGPSNTANAVAIPLTSPFTLGPVLGASTDFAGNFQGDVSALTAEDFDTDVANVSKADLIELLPGSTAAGTLNQPGRTLGAFEFHPDGSFAFVAAGGDVPQPRIESIGRDGGTSRLSISTVSGIRYRLRWTAATGLGSPIASWTAGAEVLGNGGVQTLQDSAADDIRFYAVEVVR